MRPFALFLSILALSGSVLPLRADGLRNALDRDLDGYVMGSCLAQNNDATIKKQGEALAEAIVQRSHGDIQNFLSLEKVIHDELAKSGVGVAHLDGPIASDLPLPILTCDEMRDRLTVQRAIGVARSKLRRDYGLTK